LYAHLREAFHARFDPQRFIEAKLLEQKNRHARFQDSAFKLEPNLKDSPGGLRDLHTIHWLTRARGLNRGWMSLAQSGCLSLAEARRLTSVERALARMRIHLHLLARRREDRLAFDYQFPLAERLGLAGTPGRNAGENLMRHYYRLAKQVQLANEILTLSLRIDPRAREPQSLPLNAHFQLTPQGVALIDPTLLDKQPGLIFEAFLTAMNAPSQSGFEPATLRALWRARRHIDKAFRENLANRQAFITLLRQPRGVTWALRAMNRYGILGRYLPAFGRIVGQLQHDGFHVYTVDEHTLYVLRNVRRFAVNQLAHEFPLASRLISEFDKPELLYLAALFHDIAKGRGGDHSELGRLDARQFCRRHGLGADDTALVEWLVQEHLSMSRTAQKEDLSDPPVIERFAEKVGTPRRLAALYLLTVADIRGTSPKVWNAWKGHLLETLYHVCLRRLNGQAAIQDDPSSRRNQARQLFVRHGLRADCAERFWTQLDETYFLRFEAEEIAWHARMLCQHGRQDKLVVRARLSPAGTGIEVMVYSPDRSELFARICGFFAGIQYDVREAKIHTTRQGWALDGFLIGDANEQDVHYRDFLSFVEHELARALAPDQAMPALTQGRLPRQLRHFPIPANVEIRVDEEARYHVLSLSCGDRPGLLSRIARVLHDHHVRLYSAKINTLGERVEDTFLIRGDALLTVRGELALEQAIAQVAAGH
jgi:[protein-PII] uridylyltransferase